MERIINLDNAKLFKLLKEKEAALLEGKAQYKVFEEEQTKLNKCGLKVQKVKDKIIPLVSELTKGMMGEYEDLVSVDIKEGKIALKIVDKVEEFKKSWLEAKKKYEQGTTEKTIGGGEAKTK